MKVTKINFRQARHDPASAPPPPTAQPLVDQQRGAAGQRPLGDEQHQQLQLGGDQHPAEHEQTAGGKARLHLNATETAVSTILSAIGEKDENENVTNLLLRRNKQQTDKGKAGYAMADGSIDSLYQSLPSLHCTIAPQPCTTENYTTISNTKHSSGST